MCDLFLEDVAKMEFARSTVAAGRTIIKFIKRHHFTLALYREKAKLELLLPGAHHLFYCITASMLTAAAGFLVPLVARDAHHLSPQGI